MKKKYAAPFLFIQIIFFLVQPLLVTAIPLEDPEARHGVIDLTSFEFSEDNSIALKGLWEFYWRQLLSPADFQDKKNVPRETFIKVPGLWEDGLAGEHGLNNLGYATYRLKVINFPTDRLLALEIPKIYSSYKIWINDKLLMECGKVGVDKNSTIHKRENHIAPLQPDQSGRMEIMIQVANFYHKNGGIGDAPRIGHLNSLLKEAKSTLIAETMLSSSLIIMGLGFLFLYSRWRNDKAICYFGFFCLLWAYRNISDNYAPLVEIIPFIDWELHTKLEYIALFSGSLMGSLYFNKIFIKNAHPKYKITISRIILLFIIITLISPATVFTYYLTPFFVLMLLNLVYITVIVLKSAADKHPSSIYAMAGILLGVLVFTAHIIIFFAYKSNFMMYINLGYLGVFFLSGTLLGIRFSNAFFKLELLQMRTHEQKEELRTQSDMLKAVNEQIVLQKELLQEKNEQINSINLNLEQTVNERTSRLRNSNKELDMFLYRSSHDLRRPITSIMGINNIAKMTVKEKQALTLFKKVGNVAQTMDIMLKKLISISEIYNHKLEFTKIDMGTIKKMAIDQAVFYSKIAEKKNYQLEVVGPSHIYSDPFIINKITNNLIENSIMFTKDEKNRKLKIKIEFQEIERLFKFIYSDNGPGIKKEIFDKIFNMFFIGNQNSYGNGLGLYIVKKAAEKLGEEVTVESQDGQGATFHITLNKNI